MNAPDISVVMPAYNASLFIRETLESVLAQTRPPREIVVVDDGSTDDTAAIAQSFEPQIRLIRQANRGCAGAFNRGIAEAKGEYIALCPADDLWERRKLELQSETLAAHPEVDVAFGHARVFGRADHDYWRPSGTGLLDRDTLRRELFRVNVIADPTAVVRRQLFERIGPYIEEPSIEAACEDYEFWLRALRAGATFYYDPRLLVRFRLHGGNLSANGLRQAKGRHAVHLRYAEDIGDERFVRKVLAVDLHFLGRCRMGGGELERAGKAFRDSLHQHVTPKTLFWRTVLTVPGTHAVIRAGYGARRRLRERRASAAPETAG